MEHQKPARRTPTQAARQRAQHVTGVALQAISLYKSVAHRLEIEAHTFDCKWPLEIAKNIKAQAKSLQEELHKQI